MINFLKLKAKLKPFHHLIFLAFWSAASVVSGDNIRTLPTPQLLEKITNDLQTLPSMDGEFQNLADYELTLKDSTEIEKTISKCLYSASNSERLVGKLEVGFRLTDELRILKNGVRMLAAESLSDADAKDAFRIARRAIFRCGANGFPQISLPHDEAKQIRIIFEFPSLKLSVIAKGSLQPTFEKPLRIAIPTFSVETKSDLDISSDITDLVASDLQRSGLFELIDERAHLSKISDLNAPVEYADWTAINAQMLITGAIEVGGGGYLTVDFRVHDVFAGREQGHGMRFKGRLSDWRRISHKVADEVYQRITGKSGYLDTSVVFISEENSNQKSRKRLAIMDYDGSNLEYLTDGSELSLNPSLSPDGNYVVYTSYTNGFPNISLLDLVSRRNKQLINKPDSRSFAARFSPDGQKLVFCMEKDGNIDIYTIDLRSGKIAQLTSATSLETTPSFSPDSSQIVFSSDRSGTDQLYTMSQAGDKIKRISFGDGHYRTPVWSPTGDNIAYIKNSNGRFYLGVMNYDGSAEQILTASDLDEMPVWSPNGEYIMFTRMLSDDALPALYTIHKSGAYLSKVETIEGASNASWSALRR